MSADESLASLVGKGIGSLRAKGPVPTAKQTVATTREITARWWRHKSVEWADELEKRLRSSGARAAPGFEGPSSPRTPMLPVGAGRMVDGQSDESAPVVLFLILGRNADSLSGLVTHVATLEYAGRDFRPLFVTDSTALHVFRRHDYVVEHLPSPRAWSGRDPTADDAWLPFVTRRMRSIVATYRPSVFVVYDDPAASGSPTGLVLARLLADLV